MIRIIPSADRYHYRNEWLSTYWHFSFDHYYDPENVNFGPLRVFNDDVVQPASGFPMHGHREMEILTYVLEGQLEHRDSTGGHGLIGAGEVQRMSAGTGIRHSEKNPSAGAPVHLLQMWIEPAQRGLAPSYEQRAFTPAERTGRLLPVASGQGIDGAMRIHQDATLYVSRLEEGTHATHALGASRKGYLFVVNGQLDVNGRQLSQGDQARIENEAELRLQAPETAEFVLIDLPGK